MRTDFNEIQLKRMLKMAIEKGIVYGRQGQSWLSLKKTDSEMAEMALLEFVKDIDGLFSGDNK